MSEKRYQPVSCDYHDQLEAASMHGLEVELDLFGEGDKAGSHATSRGRIRDVFTADGAEFVKFASSQGEERIRLDRIAGFREIAR